MDTVDRLFDVRRENANRVNCEQDAGEPPQARAEQSEPAGNLAASGKSSTDVTPRALM
jgi:hypothetical protein